MTSNLLPFLYAALVFSVVSFLFVLLGRIFLNVETIYIYDMVIINKLPQDYYVEMKAIIKDKGLNGWKYDGCNMINSQTMMLNFYKTRNKIRIF